MDEPCDLRLGEIIVVALLMSLAEIGKFILTKTTKRQ